MSTDAAIQALKAELRAAMNGIASHSIHESGMGYRLVYGVELPRLRQIAADFCKTWIGQEGSTAIQEGNTESQDSDAEVVAQLRHLAVELWKEDIRECKMLAIMIFPVDVFDRDMADIWVDSLRPEQAELAQLLAMDILCRTAYAADFAFCAMADERPTYQLCGFLTLTRLLMQGAEMSPVAEAEFLDQAAAALYTPYLPLTKAVQNALLRYGERSEEARQKTDSILCL